MRFQKIKVKYKIDDVIKTRIYNYTTKETVINLISGDELRSRIMIEILEMEVIK